MPHRFHLLGACIVLSTAAYSQPRTVIAADHARAEKFLGYNTTPFTSGVTGRVTWLPGDRFWYRNSTAAGTQFIQLDAAGRKYEASHLPFTDFEMAQDAQSITFHVGPLRWTRGLDSSGRCAQAVAAPSRTEVTSPDGKYVALVRN